jgi:hypothetical protein
MKNLRERIEQRIFRLRQDERFDELLMERLGHALPDLNKLVLSGRVGYEVLREFAFLAIEVDRVREADVKHEAAKYEEWIDKAVRATGYDVAVQTEQHEAFRAWFRYLHAALKARMTPDVAWRAFTRAAPKVVRALVEAHRVLLPHLLGDDETDT